MRVGNRVFGQWEWISNVQLSPTSCRIVLGWNPFYINLMVVNMTAQSMLCMVELIQSNIKFYCSIVYASNNGIERRKLWDELLLNKQSVFLAYLL